MADELLRSKHAFGKSENIDAAIEQGLIDERDILFLDEDTDKPKIGWITKEGKAVILTDEKADLSKVEADVDALEEEVSKKADIVEVNEKIEKTATESVNASKTYTDEKVEAALNEHLTKKYEITDVPTGTLIDYRENEIRIMCPSDAVFKKQSVGAGGNSNSYYMTFKTYFPSENVIGYIEHLGEQVDAEILTKSSVDKYGRRYQTTWLSIADYDEATDSWTYRGSKSTKNDYYGYDYQIDWYNADDIMIASDSIRINLSNEECHYENKPYYVANISKDVNSKIETKIEESKAYTDEQIEAVMSMFTIVEF